MPFTFEPELGRKLREKLSLGADVHDEQVAVVAAEHVAAAIDVQRKAEADAQQVTALSAEVKNLKRELSSATEKVTMLSADAPKELDPRMLGILRKQCKSAREDVINSGVVSPAGMDKVDKLLGVGESTGIALSLSADDEDETVYTRLCEIIASHPGTKTNNAVQRARPGSLNLSADRETGDVSADRKRELLNQTPLGQAVLTK